MAGRDFLLLWIICAAVFAVSEEVAATILAVCVGVFLLAFACWLTPIIWRWLLR